MYLRQLPFNETKLATPGNKKLIIPSSKHNGNVLENALDAVKKVLQATLHCTDKAIKICVLFLEEPLATKHINLNNLRGEAFARLVKENAGKAVFARKVAQMFRSVKNEGLINMLVDSFYVPLPEKAGKLVWFECDEILLNEFSYFTDDMSLLFARKLQIQVALKACITLQETMAANPSQDFSTDVENIKKMLEACQEKALLIESVSLSESSHTIWNRSTSRSKENPLSRLYEKPQTVQMNK